MKKFFLFLFVILVVPLFAQPTPEEEGPSMENVSPKDPCPPCDTANIIRMHEAKKFVDENTDKPADKKAGVKKVVKKKHSHRSAPAPAGPGFFAKLWGKLWFKILVGAIAISLFLWFIASRFRRHARRSERQQDNNQWQRPDQRTDTANV